MQARLRGVCAAIVAREAVRVSAIRALGTGRSMRALASSPPWLANRGPVPQRVSVDSRQQQAGLVSAPRGRFDVFEERLHARLRLSRSGGVKRAHEVVHDAHQDP